MNDISSRSHAVFIIHVENQISCNGGKQSRLSKLNIVDLAGSERVGVTGATGIRLEESKKINQSLSALGNVIQALTEGKKRTHVPYRDSKLTRLLEDSLGGNCKTTIIAMISPANDALSETLSTLKFAKRAKNIKNAPRINEEFTQKALISKYESEIRFLKEELLNKSQQLENMQSVLMQSKPSVAQFEVLEQQAIESCSTPELSFYNVSRSEAQIDQIQLEKERQQLEEDKAQLDRYKQLLLRQRDIMIALTARLNERDETIRQMQNEIDAYDKLHQESEDSLNFSHLKTEVYKQLLSAHSIPIPTDENLSSLRGRKIVPALNQGAQLDNSHYNKPPSPTETLKSLDRASDPKIESGQIEIMRNVLKENIVKQLEQMQKSVSENSYEFTNLSNDVHYLLKSAALCSKILEKSYSIEQSDNGENSPPEEHHQIRRLTTVDELLNRKRLERLKHMNMQQVQYFNTLPPQP